MAEVLTQAIWTKASPHEGTRMYSCVNGLRTVIASPVKSGYWQKKFHGSRCRAQISQIGPMRTSSTKNLGEASSQVPETGLAPQGTGGSQRYADTGVGTGVAPAMRP